MKKQLFKLVTAITLTAFISTSCSGTKSLANVANLSSLMGLVGSKPELTTLLSLVQTSGLTNMLSGTSLLTMLAPTNDAFSKLGGDAVNKLLNDKSSVDKLLNNHILTGSNSIDRLTEAGSVNSLAKTALDFTKTDNGAQVNGVNILESDQTKNGWAHLVDGVLGM